MKILYKLVFLLIFLSSCSTKNQLIYIKNSSETNFIKVNKIKEKNNIENGDILNISIQTIIPEAALPYNFYTTNNNQSLDLLKINGFLVDENNNINYPVLGKIFVGDLNTFELENKITDLLITGGHLTNPTVKVRRLNSKFTILGEVKNPGTFHFFEENLNIFQALGYSGDLTILGKRNDISLIREENGLRKVYKINLTKSDLLTSPYYLIKNNDVIVVNPNFSKVKSAGFIGSPSSIASIASLILSFTLLIINR